MPKTLLLIDGHSQFYRAIFSPGPALTAPGTGEPTNGTYYYTRMLLSVLRQRRPSHVAVAVDGKRSQLERRRIFPDYKADRDQKTPDPSIFVQLTRMMQITKALGLTIIRSAGWEADDVLATLVRRFKRDVDGIEVVTRDRDLHQLVSDKFNVALFDPQGDVLTRKKDVEALWGVPPKKVVEIKTLTGDSGDNVPGIGGVGMKRALDLIKQYGTVERVRENAGLLRPAVRSAILAADLTRARALVSLNSAAPLDPDPENVDALTYKRPDFAAASGLFSELGFRRLADLGED